MASGYPIEPTVVRVDRNIKPNIVSPSPIYPAKYPLVYSLDISTIGIDNPPLRAEQPDGLINFRSPNYSFNRIVIDANYKKTTNGWRVPDTFNLMLDQNMAVKSSLFFPFGGILVNGRDIQFGCTIPSAGLDPLAFNDLRIDYTNQPQKTNYVPAAGDDTNTIQVFNTRLFDIVTDQPFRFGSLWWGTPFGVARTGTTRDHFPSFVVTLSYQ